jgi:transcription antitermination factor NusG
MQSPYIKGEIRSRQKSGEMLGSKINDFKKQLLNRIREMAPKRGDVVIPKVGTFKNLEGKVTSVSRNRKTANVIFRTPSRIVEAPISVLNMDKQL